MVCRAPHALMRVTMISGRRRQPGAGGVANAARGGGRGGRRFEDTRARHYVPQHDRHGRHPARGVARAWRSGEADVERQEACRHVIHIFSLSLEVTPRHIFFFPWQKTRHCIVQRAGFDSRTRRVLLGINSPPRAVGRYPSASAMADRDGSKDFYQVKRVSFLGRKDVPIICQNENGP